jgi:hypothetical protein
MGLGGYPGAGFNPMGPMGPTPPISMTANGNTVYILRGNHVYALDARTLKLNAETELPRPAGFGGGGNRRGFGGPALPEGFSGGPGGGFGGGALSAPVPFAAPPSPGAPEGPRPPRRERRPRPVAPPPAPNAPEDPDEPAPAPAVK